MKLQPAFFSIPSVSSSRASLRVPLGSDQLIRIRASSSFWQNSSVQLFLTIAVRKSWTLEFCQKLLEARIRINWSLPSGTRSEALDEETLGMLKKAGCNFIVYAPESGDVEMLKTIKKKVKLDHLNSSIIAAKRLDLSTRANLL